MSAGVSEKILAELQGAALERMQGGMLCDLPDFETMHTQVSD
jgi:hypothetical protein